MKLYTIFKNNPSGCSVKCTGTTTGTNYAQANYNNGYFTALTDNCTNKQSKKNIITSIHNQAKKLKLQNYYIGYWKDQKTSLEYIDLSLHLKNKNEALQLAKQYKQKAIFDCKKLDSIYL